MFLRSVANWVFEIKYIEINKKSFEPKFYYYKGYNGKLHAIQIQSTPEH